MGALFDGPIDTIEPMGAGKTMSLGAADVVEYVGTEFTISGFARIDAGRPAGDGRLFTLFDEGNRRGVTLNLVTGGGGYSAQGDSYRVSFGIDDGGTPRWHDCGAPDDVSRYVSNSLTVLDGELYAATTDSADAARRAHVYRYQGGREWADLGRPPGVDAHGIGPMIAHLGSLYVAPWTYDWTAVQSLDLSPVRVYRLDSQGNWEDCGQPGHCRRIYALASFRGRLYASGDDDAVHVRGDDGQWSVSVRMPSYAHPLYVHEGMLWAATVDPGQIWAFDGHRWFDRGNPQANPDDASQLHAFCARHGELMLGSWPYGHIDALQRNSDSWRSMGAPAEATEINALQEYNGSIYAGALPYAEVSRYNGDRHWVSVRRFNAPPGWRPASVRDSGWRSRQEMGDEPNPAVPDDHLMRDWGRVTSMVEHDGQLFVSTGNCTSASADTGGDPLLGHIFAMSAGTVATSRASLSPGEHHVAAVRRGRELRLYVDGAIAAETTGEVTGRIEFSGRMPVREGWLRRAEWRHEAMSESDVVALYDGH